MGPMRVVVVRVVQYGLEVPAVEDEQVVEALAADSADPAFRIGVGPRGAVRRADVPGGLARNTSSKLSVNLVSRSHGRIRRSRVVHEHHWQLHRSCHDHGHPQFSAFSPASGKAGATVTITGQNWPALPASPSTAHQRPSCPEPRQARRQVAVAASSSAWRRPYRGAATAKSRLRERIRTSTDAVIRHRTGLDSPGPGARFSRDAGEYRRDATAHSSFRLSCPSAEKKPGRSADGPRRATSGRLQAAANRSCDV